DRLRHQRQHAPVLEPGQRAAEDRLRARGRQPDQFRGQDRRHRASRQAMTRRPARQTRAAIVLGALALSSLAAALSSPAAALDFRVDAPPNGATIMRRPCDSGPCCMTCHAGQPASERKPPKHDVALYGKYLVQIAEGTKFPIGPSAYVTREKGDLVLYEGGSRTAFPRPRTAL